MEAIGAAANPLQARDMIKSLNPDVLTLDVEMPEMDGLTFLEKLMRLRPLPVLMISSLTERCSEAALRALELGAVDFLAKPKLGISDGMREYADDIASKIRAAYLTKSRLARQIVPTGAARLDSLCKKMWWKPRAMNAFCPGMRILHQDTRTLCSSAAVQIT
jgi:two-component system chemotaxis response regulator CheB